jgi:hypothetical protein
MLNSGHLNISYYLDKKMKNYSEEKLNQALEVLRNQNGKGMRAVSRDFGIPKSTLSDHYHMISKSNKVGPGTALTVEEESLLVDAICTISSVGVGISYYHLCKIIVEYQKVKKLPIFKNGNPSKKWYKAFLKRWDEKISERKSQNLPRNRAECLTEECINNFYELVKNKSCYICFQIYKNDLKYQQYWISCEECDNWVCRFCLPNGFNPHDEFYCTKCS